MTDETRSTNIHILHGDDGFSLNRRIKEMLSSAGEPSEVDMNTTRLDGKQVSFEDIQTAASTLPFFGGARWIIVDAALAKIDKSKTEKFIKLLDTLPPTTAVSRRARIIRSMHGARTPTANGCRYGKPCTTRTG